MTQAAQPDSPAKQRLVPRWLAVLCLGIAFVGIFDRDLWTPDEPRDAAISLEMSRTGNLVVPYLAGQPFVQKPPLYFAVAGGMARLLGPLLGNTGAIRLATALFGVGVLWMTFLIARRMVGAERAVLAPVILSTMVGFVENMHWIRVDAALAFFVAAAIWAFSECYLGERRWFSLWGGVLTGLAFLSKGLIGPIMIGTAWLGLAVPWWRRKWKEGNRIPFLDMPHFLALLALAVLAGSWMVLFRIVGGAELWHEWFWRNHAGRLSGASVDLAHMRPGRPDYYLKTILLYGLPWVPAMGIGFASLFRQFRRHPATPFLVTWVVGSVLLLTVSVTKRDMYLTPVMPVLALIAMMAFHRESPRWARIFYTVWTTIAVLAVALQAFSPLIPSAWLLRRGLSPDVVSFLETFSLRHGVTLLVLIALLYLTWKRDVRPVIRLAGLTALFFIGTFTVAGKAFDIDKSMEREVRAFVASIPPERRPKVVGWNFDETMRACLYYYCDWRLPLIRDKMRLLRVVAGRDREFDSAIVIREPSLPALLNLPYRVLAEQHPGDTHQPRPLYWVEGVREP